MNLFKKRKGEKSLPAAAPGDAKQGVVSALDPDKSEHPVEGPGKPLKSVSGREMVESESTEESCTLLERLDQLESLPRRNVFLHWTAFTLCLLSMVLLGTWVFSQRAAPPLSVIGLDVGLSVFFAVEFFTRSGFLWDKWGYLRGRFFEFIAIVPVLVLVHHGLWGENAWVWLVLVLRAIRVFDRFLGDGFVRRNVLALVEGFEEEITDRVADRIVARFQADLDRAEFSRSVAEAVKRNKEAVLNRVHSATPKEGFVPGAMRVVGLDKALERAEGRAYDAVVEIIGSQEVDAAVRDVVKSSLSRVRISLGDKSWRRHLGIRRIKAK